MGRRDAKVFIERNFPELSVYRMFSSRAYMRREKPSYKDDWWLQIRQSYLEENEFIVLAGADPMGDGYQIFKVPTEFLRSNLDRFSIVKCGLHDEIWLYLHVTEHIDVRSSLLSFNEFLMRKTDG